MRYFLDISYKGTSFHGWQRQPNAYTVQEALEDAMKVLLHEEVEVVASGRTDTGVHALQQMVHFDSGNVLDHNFIYKLNHILPEAIVANHLYLVPNDAHARFDAIVRSYQYHLHVRKDPFLKELSYRLKPTVDIDRLNSASSMLIGTHDFCSFSRVQTDVAHFGCEVYEAHWEKTDNKIVFHVSANRFLRGMVRALVGTMLEVGTGKKEPEWIKQILAAKDRRAAGMAVHPEGLYLSRVTYPEALLNNIIV